LSCPSSVCSHRRRPESPRSHPRKCNSSFMVGSLIWDAAASLVTVVTQDTRMLVFKFRVRWRWAVRPHIARCQGVGQPNLFQPDWVRGCGSDRFRRGHLFQNLFSWRVISLNRKSITAQPVCPVCRVHQLSRVAPFSRQRRPAWSRWWIWSSRWRAEGSAMPAAYAVAD